MPPRKSNASTTTTTAAAATAPSTSTPTSPTATTPATPAAGGADTSILSTTEPKSPSTKKSSRQQQDDLGIDDLLLPRSLTSRIARGVLPPNTSLQKDALLALTKSATVFISFLASTANEQRPSAKTVTPQDVLKALQEMELEKVMALGERGEDGEVVGGRLEKELAVFEEVVRGKRKGYREKVKARESVGGAAGGEGEGDADADADGGEREAKRARRDGSAGGENGAGSDDEDALLDAQLNGQMGGVDGDEEGDEEDDEGNDAEDLYEEQQDEDDADDTIDVEDELEGKPHRNGSGSRGVSSILAPNGTAELGSDDDSD